MTGSPRTLDSRWTTHKLADDSVRLAVIPELGGKIVSLRSVRSGREWLWANPYLPLREPERGGSYVQRFDSGGWDEVLPTVDPCKVEGTPWGGGLTDHGEMWCRAWHVTEAGRDAVSLELDDPGLPVRVRRRISLGPGEGRVSIGYTLHNRGGEAVPFIWAAHPLMAIEPGMRIELPPGMRVGCVAKIGAAPVRSGETFDWPYAGGFDFSHVPGRDAGFAVKLFTGAMGGHGITLVSPDGSESLRFRVTSGLDPRIGLWLNYGGWSGAGTVNYFNAGIEPTTTPGDRLDAAIRDRTAAMLDGGAERRWTLTVELAQHKDSK